MGQVLYGIMNIAMPIVFNKVDINKHGEAVPVHNSTLLSSHAHAHLIVIMLVSVDLRFVTMEMAHN